MFVVVAVVGLLVVLVLGVFLRFFFSRCLVYQRGIFCFSFLRCSGVFVVGGRFFFLSNFCFFPQEVDWAQEVFGYV